MTYLRQNGSFHLEGLFSKNAQGILAMMLHKILLLMNFLQTKHQIENIKKGYYDLYYTISKIFSDERGEN